MIEVKSLILIKSYSLDPNWDNDYPERYKEIKQSLVGKVVEVSHVGTGESEEIDPYFIEVLDSKGEYSVWFRRDEIEVLYVN